MRVVSNTTPISELFKIGRLDVLRLVYGHLMIPEAVAHELRSAQTRPGLARVIDQTPWISVCPLVEPEAPKQLRFRYPTIHEGEAAAMVLAKEIDATRILLDDKHARQAAHSEGLPLIGTALWHLLFLFRGRAQGRFRKLLSRGAGTRLIAWISLTLQAIQTVPLCPQPMIERGNIYSHVDKREATDIAHAAFRSRGLSRSDHLSRVL